MRNKKERELKWQAEEQAKIAEWTERIQHCYHVPSYAVESYLNLEDAVGETSAKAILDLITTLYGEPKDSDDG